MTAVLVRLVIFAAIGLAIYWGGRKIWRDWTKQFRDLDAEQRARDLNERKRPDVITLKRDKDGTYRPGDDGGR